MRAAVVGIVAVGYLAGALAAAGEERGIAFRPKPGATASFAVVHQVRYRRGDGLVDGPGASYRLSLTVSPRSAGGYSAQVTVGAVTRLPAAVPGIDLDTALAHGLDGLTFALALDEAGRPVAIEEWGEFRIELIARALRGLSGDPAGALVASTTSRLIRSLDGEQAARLLARPLALMAEVRHLPYRRSQLRVDLRLAARTGATLLPGPYDWDVSFEPIALGGHIAARWQARPTAGTLEHREDGAGVWREDGWASRLYWTATTLNEGDLTERTLAVTMVGAAGR